MYRSINHIYIYQKGEGECFPVPVPPTFGDKILSTSPSLSLALAPSPNIAPQSSRHPVSAGNTVIPNFEVYFKIDALILK